MLGVACILRKSPLVGHDLMVLAVDTEQCARKGVPTSSLALTQRKAEQ